MKRRQLGSFAIGTFAAVALLACAVWMLLGRSETGRAPAAAVLSGPPAPTQLAAAAERKVRGADEPGIPSEGPRPPTASPLMPDRNERPVAAEPPVEAAAPKATVDAP